MTDMDKALALVPTAAATKTAVQSGPFSDPATWGGAALADGDMVWVPAGLSVVYDMPASPRLKWLRVDGTLTIDPNAALKLYVDTFVTTMGSNLTLDNATGTGSFQCVFTGGPIDTVADPYMLGRVLIPMGPVRLYGRPITAWGYTTGNAAGSSVVTMLAPVVGWSVGDQLVFPGTGYGTVDDDLRTIQSISADGLTVTLSSPLQFDHRQAQIQTVGGTRELVPVTGLTSGWNRPAFVVNRGGKRSIEFESEVKDVISQRGHLMFMNMNDTVAQYVATRGTGRSDKSRVVTDPDGAGGGLDNPRGRYGWHYHKCGPALTGMKAMNSNLFIDGSPGWGFVNHDSYVDCDDSAAYGVYGSHFAGEVGTETGCFCRCAAVRSARPNAAGVTVDNDRGASDWGYGGHGFWLQAGGITLEDCVASGVPSEAFMVMGLPFSKASPPAFARANLPAGYTYSQSTLPPNYVPQDHAGLAAFGVGKGFAFWAMGVNGDGALVPPVGRSRLADCYLETFGNGYFHGYSSNIDTARVRCRGSDPKFNKNYGFHHTGVNTAVTFADCDFLDYDVGVSAANKLGNAYTNVRVKAITGVAILNPYWTIWRTLDLGFTFHRFDPTSLAAALKANPYGHVYYNTPTQGLTPQLDYLAYANAGGNSLYAVAAVPDFAGATTPGAAPFHPDTIRANGGYLFFPEEYPGFPLSKLKAAAVPPVLAGLTNGQMWARYGLALGGRLLPADAAMLPGSLAYFSTSPPTDLPKLSVNQAAGVYVQYANSTTYRAPCKNVAGAWVWSEPQVLTDRAWNVVRVTADGFSRGVLVYCDTASTPVLPWNPMPTQPVQ